MKNITLLSAVVSMIVVSSASALAEQECTEELTPFEQILWCEPPVVTVGEFHGICELTHCTPTSKIGRLNGKRFPCTHKGAYPDIEEITTINGVDFSGWGCTTDGGQGPILVSCADHHCLVEVL